MLDSLPRSSPLTRARAGCPNSPYNMVRSDVMSSVGHFVGVRMDDNESSTRFLFSTSSILTVGHPEHCGMMSITKLSAEDTKKRFGVSKPIEHFPLSLTEQEEKNVRTVLEYMEVRIFMLLSMSMAQGPLVDCVLTGRSGC